MPNAMGSAVMIIGEVTQPVHVRQDLLVTSVLVMDIEITIPVGDIPMAGIDVPIADELADPQYTDGGDLNYSDYETRGIMIMTSEDWCDSDIRDRYCGFPPACHYMCPGVLGERHG